MDVPDQLRELFFPFGGVYVACAFDQQPAGTTPIGFNVRAYEPSASRRRGGARPGLTKHFTEALPAELQNLGLVVSTDPSAQIGTFDADDPSYPTYPIVPIGGTFGPAFPSGHFTPVVGGGPNTDTLEDPSSDGTGNPVLGQGGNGGRNPSPRRRLRRGGQGRSITRYRHQSSTGQPIQRIGQNATTFDQATGVTHTVVLAGVVAGDLIAVTVFVYVGTVVSLTDSQGNTYTLAKDVAGRLGIWWATAAATGTVTVTLTTSGGVPTPPGVLSAINYRYVAASPVDGTASNSGFSNTVWTTGSIPVSNTGTLALAAFVDLSFLAAVTFTAGTGFSLREDLSWDILPFRFALEDQLGLSAAVTANLNVSVVVPENYAAVGVTFLAEDPNA